MWLPGRGFSAFVLKRAGISVARITGAVDQFFHICEAEKGQHKGNGFVFLTEAKLSCARLFQRNQSCYFEMQSLPACDKPGIHTLA